VKEFNNFSPGGRNGTEDTSKQGNGSNFDSVMFKVHYKAAPTLWQSLFMLILIPFHSVDA
jgi:hypothetical protein